tara:strand:- start:2832 stop:3134 length:303 start_codon:yes stop_codon:yes gene_type:complete
MLADGTYDKDGRRIKRMGGYQVGIWNQPINVNKTHQNLERIIKEMTKTCDEFGAWRDTNGDFYLEPCVWIEDLPTAERVGRALKQLAIWDWANMTEIRLN